MSLRVLVVDDTSIFRKLVTNALAGLPDVEVVGTASNGKLALERIEALRPDLLTLDVDMPEMNGIEVLEAISRSGAETGVIMLSALTVRGGEMTLRALDLGAFDFIAKPDGGTFDANLALLKSQLAPRVQAFARRREIRQQRAARRNAAPLVELVKTLPATPITPQRINRSLGPPIVLIGVSTGGPVALAKILPELPETFPSPILIVQHMPPLFTGALATSLQTKCRIRIKEAEDGEIASAGCVYIAPGGKHMKVIANSTGKPVININDDPPEGFCKPAVDVLFRSAASHFPKRTLAVILTGMGSDGTEGLKALRRAGCISIAQDEATCVVFGMPREAIRNDLIDHVVPLGMMASEIIRQVDGTR